jgi:hypothetical protein
MVNQTVIRLVTSSLVAQYEVLILGFLCGKNYWYYVVDLCALIAHSYIEIFLSFPFVI